MSLRRECYANIHIYNSSGGVQVPGGFHTVSITYVLRVIEDDSRFARDGQADTIEDAPRLTLTSALRMSS